MTTNEIVNKKINGNNNGLSHVNSDISARDDDDESIQIQIQKTDKETKMYKDFDIKYEDEEDQIVLYIDLCPADLQNLIKDASLGHSKNKFDDQRNLIKNCIFYRNIETPNSKVKGNFHITYIAYKGITFNIYLNRKKSDDNPQAIYPLRADQYLFSKLKIMYDSSTGYQDSKFSSKWRDTHFENQVYSWNVEAPEIEKIMNSKLLLQIFFDRQTQQASQYLGLINDGNLCYMNSLLQVLYHFIPLRKIVVQQPKTKKNQFIKYLQQIFVDLEAGKTAPSSERLLDHFEQFNSYPRQQQDIHQFMISLFDDLEKQCPETKQLWCGKDEEIIQSKDKNYKSEQKQDFNELQLNMFDSKGNPLQTVVESLKQMLMEEKMDEQLDTDDFGKIVAFKTRKIEYLPPLLFMNIKRYQYNSKRKQLRKMINSYQTYPYELNLDFLLETPGIQLSYILYAVVVHKGRSPNAGHYFTFINLTKNPNSIEEADFYEFNDSRVYKTRTEKVLNGFTGKKKSEIVLNQQYGRWVQKQIDSQQTAYMLAYIRKDQFQVFQNTEYLLPTWHFERLQQKLTQQQARTKIQCKVLVFKEEIEFKPFSLDQQFLEVKLLKNQLIYNEMQKLEPFMTSDIQSIWKVNIRHKTIKSLTNNTFERKHLTLSRICEYKRGFRQPDYFLIMPRLKNSQMSQLTSELGILHIQEITESEQINKFTVIEKRNLLEMIDNMSKEGSCLTYDKDELDYFLMDWNDYMFIRKQ